ncbi:hypothetical protein B0H11DRAFT_1906638 [Mycena galericulata]|nr:hypothetical protein B0H11DRAFT_1906638 [Mycena galericulata]
MTCKSAISAVIIVVQMRSNAEAGEGFVRASLLLDPALNCMPSARIVGSRPLWDDALREAVGKISARTVAGVDVTRGRLGEAFESTALSGLAWRRGEERTAVSGDDDAGRQDAANGPDRLNGMMAAGSWVWCNTGGRAGGRRQVCGPIAGQRENGSG